MADLLFYLLLTFFAFSFASSAYLGKPQHMLPSQKVEFLLNHFASYPTTYTIQNAEAANTRGNTQNKITLQDVVLHVEGPVKILDKPDVNKNNDDYSLHLSVQYEGLRLSMLIQETKTTKRFIPIFDRKYTKNYKITNLPIDNRIILTITVTEKPIKHHKRYICKMKLNDITPIAYIWTAVGHNIKDDYITIDKELIWELTTQLYGRMVENQLQAAVEQAIKDYKKVKIEGCEYE